MPSLLKIPTRTTTQFRIFTKIFIYETDHTVVYFRAKRPSS
jgi:hypothetical protein